VAGFFDRHDWDKCILKEIRNSQKESLRPQLLLKQQPHPKVEGNDISLLITEFLKKLHSYSF
jgi:hypothetical protein